MTATFAVTWFRNVRQTTGLEMPYTPAELAAWWTGAPHPLVQEKRDLPVWCAALFQGHQRALERVETVTGLAFDFDAVGASMRDVLDRLRVACAGHTTWSHGAKDGACFRVVVFLTRPVSTLEHARLWRRFAEAFARWGAPLDERARDASRAWFVPCRTPTYDAHAELARPILNVDKALARLDSVPSLVSPGEARQERAARRSDPGPYERAAAYVASMPPAIQGSDGSGATMRAAVALVRGFALDEAAALELLTREFNPRCKPQWSARELQHKVASAAKATRAGLGYLLPGRTR